MSPYAKHAKTPYLYSQELRNWHNAVRANDPKAIAYWRDEWDRKHGVNTTHEG